MVSPEYPSISDGVAWYTFNLGNEILKSDCEVLFFCDQKQMEVIKVDLLSLSITPR